MGKRVPRFTSDEITDDAQRRRVEQLGAEAMIALASETVQFDYGPDNLEGAAKLGWDQTMNALLGEAYEVGLGGTKIDNQIHQGAERGRAAQREYGG